MQRRGWLQLGAVTALFAAGGAGWAWKSWPRARTEGHFEAATAAMLLAVGRAVLEGLLPVTQPQADQALQQWLTRLAATVDALPPATQAEVDLLLGALAQGWSRAALTGEWLDWAAATPLALQQQLQQLRTSGLAERQQVYHALRDLATAAYLADASTWPQIGYPGPALRFQSV